MRWIALSVLLFGLLSCTDASLYGAGGEDPSANRLGLTGQVCTDDPKEAGFPVRVIFLVDTAMGPMFSSFDLEQLRIKALQDTLGLHGGNEAFSFAVIGFGGTARLLAPQDGYFTRNPGEIENAIDMVALPGGCVGGVCRDYFDGLELAESIIEGDLTDMNAGERSRTQYAVVLLTGGPQDPMACDYDCCDPEIEECNFSDCNPSVPCTQTRLRDEVGRLRDDVESQGASAFSLHVLFLAARDDTTGITEQVLDETEEMLKEMAFTGAGRFERFNSADAVTLDRIGLTKLSSLFEVKLLMVTNRSVLPGLGEPNMDSDGDGIGDAQEQDIGTDHLVPDTDGDGIGDMVERLILFDPLLADEPPSACVAADGPPYTDRDADHLNECEELLLGTDPSLPDTDGDGIPDWEELSFGTDYLHYDTLTDSDGDGTPNGDESINHTDPRSSDAASHLGSAYRYEVTDQGLVKEQSISNPRRIAGVTILTAGDDTTAGLGIMRYTAGPPASLSWQDPQDTDPGPIVNISEGGEIELPSSSVAVGELERWITVEVDTLLLPPTPAEERLLVQFAERQCISFTVRNIRLMETEAMDTEGGENDVFIYFAQAPAGRLTLPGLFRVAHIPVEYHSDTGRDPSDLLVEVNDDEFAAIGY